MVGEKNDGIQNEAVMRTASLYRVVKHCPSGLVGEDWGAAFGDEGEEKRSAWAECSDVVGHCGSFGCKRWASTPTLQATSYKPYSFQRRSINSFVC